MEFLVTGDGVLAYNAAKKILGALPVGRTIAYHLFSLDYDIYKHNCDVKLLRKTKWWSQFHDSRSNLTINMSFNTNFYCSCYEEFTADFQFLIQKNFYFLMSY